MNSLAAVWTKLDARRRAAVVLATLATLVAMALLARGPGQGEMALLYAGLEPAAAGEVVAALEGRGTPFEVRGDAIWVPLASRDLERMSLASEGLPAASAQGYELLDSLSGFGTTAQMFDAAYWRAKEGELARTILAVPQVRAARVHLAADASSPFRRDGRATASVTVTTDGGTLPAAQGRALRHLVAAAVPGLAPADVAVIDSVGGLLSGEDEAEAPDAQAEALRERALRLLEARVGPGNAVVEVSVEAVTETETLRERSIDPESRIAISTEAEESETSSQGPGGAVTVASNLPDGEAANGGESEEGSESRTVTNYEVSETSREVLRGPGAVRRLTVAVLVNDVAGPEGEAPTPRPAEEIAALGELVGAAVGLNAERGDVLTIRSMTFEARPALGSDPALPGGAPLDLLAWARPVILALVALGLGLFVVRPILRPGPAALALPAPEPLAPGGPAGPYTLAPPATEAYPGLPGAPGAPGLPGPDGIEEAEVVDPVTRLRRLIESRQEETAQILQTWLDDPKADPASNTNEGARA